ncbi:MAG: clostripain-related cysteine peptidase [Fimbriimonadales bacterium]|nr:clostripain-related cysteine peptidase [Fimbriimonadales bacterium]MDW8052030.1 clostripain-related cysteine peptidase [Armatimonadota bacterium]
MRLMLWRVMSLLSLCVVGFVVSSCGIGRGRSSAFILIEPCEDVPARTRAAQLEVPPARTGTRWTIMVFLNAANDLDEYSELNVNQMEQAQTNPNVRVVVQWKRSRRFAPPNSWTGTRRYLIQYDTNPSEIRSQLLEDLGEGVDMGSAATLREFIQWAQTNFPADRYALVIWNHGSGWRARAAAEGRAVSFDDELRTSIKIWELPTAIRPTSDAPVLDALLFDASLMQMLEVAYECRYVARYIVGSEESPPGEGYPYHEILAPLMQNPAMPTREWVAQIPEIFVSWYAANYPYYTNITQSAVDTSKLEVVATAVDCLASVLLAKRSLYTDALRLARQEAQSYSTYPEYRDLWHAAQLLKERTGDADIAHAVNLVHQSLNLAVVSNRRANNSRVFHSYGLSIYYPHAGDYLGRYGNTAFARATRWDEWLQVAP